MDVHRISVTQGLIDALGAQTYLEIGVSRGYAFLSMRAPRKLGVDVVDRLPRHLVRGGATLGMRWRGWRSRWRQRLGLEETCFFEMPSDEFFARHADLVARHPIDVALIDGLHSYEQALRDVEHCLRALSPRGAIVLHDCNPTTAAMALPARSHAAAGARDVPGWDGSWCGDVWKAIVALRRRADLCVFTLECDMGVGVVVPGQPDDVLSLPPERIAAMTYDDLARDRSRLLNLKPPAHIETVLADLRRCETRP